MKIFGKFTVEQAATLKKELSYEQWRTIKRLLRDVAARDVVGSEQNLKQFLKHDCYYEYEAGSFTNEAGNEVTFVRVMNLTEVVKQTVIH